MGKNLNTASQALEEAENGRSHAAIKEELAARAEEMRSAAYELAAYGLRLGAISQQEAADLMNIQTPKDEDELKTLERFMRDGIPSQRRAYERVHDKFSAMISEARGVLSLSSLNEWIDRFNTTTFLEKHYFIEHQFRSYIDNWKEIHEKRDRLETKAKMFLTKEDVPELATFLNGMSFKDLRYRDKKNLTAQVEAALASRESVDHSSLYAKAKGQLEAAVSEGILSSQKVGIWLHRIFGKNANLAQIKLFLGKGHLSLSWYMSNWRHARREFDAVTKELKKSENIARGFNRITTEAFLQMDYDQRMSYVAEAKRTIEASNDTDKEASILLEIRHYLDLEDWDDAEDAIRTASGIDLDATDKSRLESMKRYLREHRKDGGTVKLESSQADVDSANEGINAALARLDPSMRAIAMGLLPFGNKGISNLRWTIYNHIWCAKNGYLNDDRAQKNHDDYKDVTKERAERQEDRGSYDVVDTGDARLFRTDEHQKNAKSRATYQFLNIAEDGVKSQTIKWYSQDRDPKQLYWTTAVATKGDETMSVGWHQQQLECLNELRRCTRILENSGKRARIVTREQNGTPETSYATAA